METDGNKLIPQRHDPTSEMLYVPLQLLPRYPDIPLRATILLHHPVELSQMILQPLSHDEATIPEIDDLNLKSLLSGGSGGEADGKDRSNGLVNGNGHHSPLPFRIFREGHNVLIPTTSNGHSLPFRILMLEPVAQGYLTSNTKVILSTIPYDPGPDDDDGDAEGSIYGQSSHGKTHLSMADFDPDAFLSSSLALALHSSSVNGEDADGEVERSVSSTSGSITPRPPGAGFRPSSPPARPHDMEDLDGMDADTAGTRFGAVVANGPAGRQDDVCWVSVGGLGRAGIFEGDWVSSSW
jgi:peroxin-6